MPEYAVPIWNGALAKKYSERIEKVQKIVLKLLLRQKYTSYTEACENFKLDKLSDRRHKMCLKFALKEFKKESNIFNKINHKSRRKVSKKKLVQEPKSRTQRHYSSCYAYLSRLLNENQ